MTEMEPPADTSWIEMEPVTGQRRFRRWTVEERRLDGKPRNPFFVPPEFWCRWRAERWVRKHACGHHVYDVAPVRKRCCC